MANPALLVHTERNEDVRYAFGVASNQLVESLVGLMTDHTYVQNDGGEIASYGRLNCVSVLSLKAHVDVPVQVIVTSSVQ